MITKKKNGGLFYEKVILHYRGVRIIGGSVCNGAVLLKKLKISLSIEGIDDSIVDDNDNPDSDLSIEDEEPNFGETEEVVEAALDEMLDEDDEKEIEVEISEL